MKKRERILQARLQAMENEFHGLLMSCLEECSKGRWRLFEQNAAADPEGRFWVWPEAKMLRALALEISELGGQSRIFQRFLELCREHGANTPGEPKLAANFLKEIQSESFAER